MTPETAAAAAGWWAEQLEVVDKHDAFRAALERRLIAGPGEREDFGRFVRLRVDYDPSATLLAALRDAGIECRGMMFSADGLLPIKTEMHVWRDDGTVEFFVYRRGFRARVPSRTPGFEWIAGPKPKPEVEVDEHTIADTEAWRLHWTPGARGREPEPEPEPVPVIAARVFWRDGSSSTVELLADIARRRVVVVRDPRQQLREPSLLEVGKAGDMRAITLRTITLHRHRLLYPPDFSGPLESDDVFVLQDLPGYHRGGWREVGVLVEDGSPWRARWQEMS